MPRRYKRKEGVRPRAFTWSTAQLQAAFDDMDKNILGVNEIARKYGIPSRTLRRRHAAKNTTRLTLGKHPVLDFEHEKRMVTHILKLGAAGFPPDRRAIRMLAYQFAEKLGIKHNFDHETQMAGQGWFQSFIERNSELSIRQAEGTSKKRIVVRRKDRQMIASVYHFLKNEYEFTERYRGPNCKCDFTHLRNITKRTANATGVSESTVQKVLKEEREILSKGNVDSTSVKFTSPMKNRRKRKNKIDIDKRTADVIRSTIEDFNVGQKDPTLAKLKTILNDKIGFDGCVSTLSKLLRRMGYRWHKVDKNRKMLVQRHDTQNCKSEYLTKTANQDNSEDETDSDEDSCYDST